MVAARDEATCLDLAILGAGGEEVGVARQGERDDGAVVQHELLVCLVLQVLAQPPRHEVPHLEHTHARCSSGPDVLASVFISVHIKGQYSIRSV